MAATGSRDTPDEAKTLKRTVDLAGDEFNKFNMGVSYSRAYHFLLISFKKSDGAILMCCSRSSWSYQESLDGRKRNSGIPHDVLT
jgi:hypothetical protein